MQTIFLAFVIQYCAFCERFKEEALPGIIASKEVEVVVWNESNQEFEVGFIHNIDQYKKYVVGYPSYVIIQDNEVTNSWNGYEEYNFWLEYNDR